MITRLSLYILCAVLALLLSSRVVYAEQDTHEKYAVYYADKIPVERFKPYHFLVLDGQHHPSLQPLKEDGKLVIAYISLGEVDMTSPSYATLQSHGLILKENKNWKGSFFVDIRNPLWPKIVIEDLIPQLLRQGFDGVFLDTLDNPSELEEENPKLYHGMTDAAAHLVEAIRLNYPQIKIMMNRGYALLPKVAASTDMVLAESLYYDYNFDTKTYGKVSAQDYAEQLKALKDAQRINPQLKIYSLDYAQPTDTKTIADIYKTERANGFTPYVATVGLDLLVDEPKGN
ncbi:MAG: endo alpha-1,4 polygalactosaminidase [Alphaproteobacteria bacterium]